MYKKIIYITGIICSLFLGAGVAIGNTDNSASQSQSEVVITANFYTNANVITNKYFKRALTFFDAIKVTDPDYLTLIQTAILPPQGLLNNDISSCENSISSVCLQLELENLFLSTQPRLLEAKNRIVQNTANSPNFNQISSEFDVRREFIDEQITYMHSINAQTVEFYRQLLFAYPIHIQNQSTKESLKKFVDNLKTLEQSLEPYSGLFHNVTTAQCL